MNPYSIGQPNCNNLRTVLKASYLVYHLTEATVVKGLTTLSSAEICIVE